jgi:hypothetical protein
MPTLGSGSTKSGIFARTSWYPARASGYFPSEKSTLDFPITANMFFPRETRIASSNDLSAPRKRSTFSESTDAPLAAIAFEGACRDALNRYRTPRARNKGGKEGLIREASLRVETASCR